MTQSTIDQTMAFILRRRGVLKPYLEMFSPIFRKRDDLLEQLSSMLTESSPLRMHREQNGEPILANMPLQGFGPVLRIAADTMLPVIVRQLNLDDQHLEAFFNTAPERTLEELLGWLIGRPLPEALSGKSDTELAYIRTAGEFICSPVLTILAQQAAGEMPPWNEEGVWNEGYCPVCGSYPSIGWLDRPAYDEKNAFLAGGGGKKHLHCPMCGTSWKFRRAVCPNCHSETEGSIEILSVADAPGERLDCCNKCHAYCPVVDLRELADMPHMDTMSVGMLHLDIAAGMRNLKPLRPSLWNSFQESPDTEKIIKAGCK